MDPIEHFALDRKDFPSLRYSGELLIVGGGRCVWDDLNGLCIPDHVMCINDIGMHYPGRIRHWYSNDVEQLPHWSEGRRRKYVQKWGRDYKLHSAFKRDWIKDVYHWPFPSQGGSGVTACLVARAMGYSPIILAGVPLDNSGHYFDPPDGHPLSEGEPFSTFLNETQDRHIERARGILHGHVRALSGRLKW